MTTSAPRVALYFSPAPDTPLTTDAARWLGRDVWTGEASEPARPDLVSSPRRYGFHATLKAPFHLKDSDTMQDLVDAAEEFAAERSPVTIPKLSLGRLGPFFALVEDEPSEAVSGLAADVVTAFEPFRTPLSDDDLARRRSAGLTDRQDELLRDYGYPHVLDQFRFHMTLTGPVHHEDRDEVEAELKEHFAPHLGLPLEIDALSVFEEEPAGGDFVGRSRHPFGSL